jgi:hypothetical protein
MIRHILRELLSHMPFTAIGAAVGIVVMVIIHYANTSADVSEALFFTFHPLHVVFSALVTTALYRKQPRSRRWLVVIVGYTGSIGIATLSDAVIPFIGGTSMSVSMSFHLPFIETDLMPFLGIPKWIVVNAAAFIGIGIGYFKPNTKFPHMGHVLLSTWASLFGFTAFGVADWIPLLPFVFIYLFLAVWLPCCVSDIVYPLLWTGNGNHHVH